MILVALHCRIGIVFQPQHRIRRRHGRQPAPLAVHERNTDALRPEIDSCYDGHDTVVQFAWLSRQNAEGRERAAVDLAQIDGEVLGRAVQPDVVPR